MALQRLRRRPAQRGAGPRPRPALPRRRPAHPHTHPRYDRGRETLTYRATPLRGKDAGALDSFARRGDPVRPGGFGAASLFVDDGGAGFAQITLTFDGATAGQTISFRAAPADGGRVAWSLGPPSWGQYGLQVDGSIPLNAFSLRGSTLNLTTASEGGTLGFTVSLALELEATEAVSLSVTGDAGAAITATVLTPDGPETQQLGSTPTLFADLASF